MLLKTTLSTVLAIGLVGGLSNAQAEGNSLSKVIDYRNSVMTVYKWNIGPMGGMLKGKIPYDAETFAKHARELNNATHLDLLAGFPEDSEGPDSDARADIWMDWDGFSAKYDDLKRATAALALTAPSGDLQAIGPKFGAVGKACKGCHDNYRD